MNHHELHNSVKSVRAISPLTQTNSDAVITGEIIDRQGFEAAEFFLSSGALTDANATFAVALEEGDNSGLSDAATVASSDLHGSLPSLAAATDDNKEFRFGYKGTKRYLRVKITPSGNDVGSASLSCVAVLGAPHLAAVA